MPLSNLHSVEQLIQRFSVSKATISRWCKELGLEPAQKSRNRHFYNDQAVETLARMAALLQEGSSLEDAARQILGKGGVPPSADTERLLEALDGQQAFLELIYKGVMANNRLIDGFTAEIAHDNLRLERESITQRETIERLERENAELRAALEDSSLLGRAFKTITRPGMSLLGLEGKQA